MNGNYKKLEWSH